MVSDVSMVAQYVLCIMGFGYEVIICLFSGEMVVVRSLHAAVINDIYLPRTTSIFDHT